jgi:hypothetical protein
VYLDVVKKASGEKEMQGVEYTVVAKAMGASEIVPNFFDVETGKEQEGDMMVVIKESMTSPFGLAKQDTAKSGQFGGERRSTFLDEVEE